MKLERTAEHVYYEVMMLHYTTSILTKIVDQPNTDIRSSNAVLESWAMHVRNLLAFFYTPTNQRKQNDDVLVGDYVKNLKQFRKDRTKAKTFLGINKRIAKQFAHLTYHRNVYNRKTKVWQFKRIYIQLHTTIKAFYEALPEHAKMWPHFVEMKKIIDAGY